MKSHLVSRFVLSLFCFYIAAGFTKESLEALDSQFEQSPGLDYDSLVDDTSLTTKSVSGAQLAMTGSFYIVIDRATKNHEAGDGHLNCLIQPWPGSKIITYQKPSSIDACTLFHTDENGKLRTKDGRCVGPKGYRVWDHEYGPSGTWHNALSAVDCPREPHHLRWYLNSKTVADKYHWGRHLSPEYGVKHGTLQWMDGGMNIMNMAAYPRFMMLGPDVRNHYHGLIMSRHGSTSAWLVPQTQQRRCTITKILNTPKFNCRYSREIVHSSKKDSCGHSASSTESKELSVSSSKSFEMSVERSRETSFTWGTSFETSVEVSGEFMGIGASASTTMGFNTESTTTNSLTQSSSRGGEMGSSSTRSFSSTVPGQSAGFLIVVEDVYHCPGASATVDVQCAEGNRIMRGQRIMLEGRSSKTQSYSFKGITAKDSMSCLAQKDCYFSRFGNSLRGPYDSSSFDKALRECHGMGSSTPAPAPASGVSCKKACYKEKGCNSKSSWKKAGCKAKCVAKCALD